MGLKYNEVFQKSSHNSYQKYESIPDQLTYHMIRSIEFDLHISKLGYSDVNGDWFCYHHAADTGTTVHMFSDALAQLKAWHNINPNHEVVTIWMDVNDLDSSTHKSADFDNCINSYLGSDLLWTPADAKGAGASMQANISANGFPELTALQGKFIFIFTKTYDAYADNGNDIYNRSCFTARNIDSTSKIDDRDWEIFFNLGTGNGSVGSQIYTDGFISRQWYVNSSSQWNTSKGQKCHHFATDDINYHEDSYTITHNSKGYPFGTYTTTDISGYDTDLENTISIEVDSGDVWGSDDEFVFLHEQETSSDTWIEWICNVATVNSHCEDWTKGGLMVRASAGDDNDKYFCILRAGENKALRNQYRTSNGGSTSNQDAPSSLRGQISANGDIDDDCIPFLKIRYKYQNGTSYCEGYGSNDGVNWILIGSKQISGQLKYQGIWACSHDDHGNADNSKIKYAFSNVKKGSIIKSCSDFTKTNIGDSGDVSHSVTYDGILN